MKKVLFVATVTTHINFFHIPYLKMFKEKGYEVHVASFGEEPIEYCDKHFNIPFARFPFKLQNYKVYKKLKKIINDNDYKIIHCHTPVGGLLTRLAAKKVRKKGTKVIYTAHGFHFYKGAPILNWMIYYPIEKYLSKYTDCLITINEEDYEIAKKKFKAKRTEFVHGVGVDENKFNFEMSNDEKEDVRKSLNLKEDDFVISYVAELSKRKNQGMLIKAISELINEEKIKNIKVLLIGSDSLNNYYQQMSKDLNVESSIMFLGYRKDIPKLLKISDLYVSTSTQEGLPINLVEAAICKLPIIATNCRGNRNIAKKIVKIDDVNELCNEIKKCMKNNELYITTKLDEYKLENVMKEMEEIYENIMKG